MRAVLQAWWCGACKTRNDADCRTCGKCGKDRIERHAQVHSSEKSVVYWNPHTGEHRTPALSYLPVPEIYARQGFERREIQNMGQYERQTGVIHEDSNYNSGNALDAVLKPPEPRPKDPKIIDALVDHLRS